MSKEKTETKRVTGGIFGVFIPPSPTYETTITHKDGSTSNGKGLSRGSSEKNARDNAKKK